MGKGRWGGTLLGNLRLTLPSLGLCREARVLVYLWIQGTGDVGGLGRRSGASPISLFGVGTGCCAPSLFHVPCTLSFMLLSLRPHFTDKDTEVWRH